MTAQDRFNFPEDYAGAEPEEIEHIVPQEKLENVRTSATLRPYLSHSKLRKVIREIGTSRNKNRRLQQQLELDSDFRVFIDMMLKEMGYLDENN